MRLAHTHTPTLTHTAHTVSFRWDQIDDEGFTCLGARTQTTLTHTRSTLCHSVGTKSMTRVSSVSALAHTHIHPHSLTHVAHTVSYRWDQIDDEGFIYLGALPFSIFLQSLIHRERISAVITLNQPWELSLSCWGVLNARDLKRYSIEHLHVPLLDHFSSPDPQSIQRVVDFMNNLIIQKKRMYIHCKAGRSVSRRGERE